MLDLRILQFQAKNFRNLDEDITDFSPRINCIFGNNGNGKTNFLEAMYYLVNRKSFRKNTGFLQMLTFDGDTPQFSLKALFKEELCASENDFVRTLNYACHNEKEKSRWVLNNIEGKRLKTEMLFIGPFDAHTFFNTPKERRTLFDQLIGSSDATYKKLLNNHNLLLKQRNSLLSNKTWDWEKQVKATDEQLAIVIPQVINLRYFFIREIKKTYPIMFKKIFSEEHQIDLSYDTKFKDLSQDFVYNFLQSNLLKDSILGYTTYSVHKDDFKLFLDGFDTLEYASIGQQKMSYLSLIFSYIEAFHESFYASPILLIDDMSGELDEERWQRLINFLEEKNIQVFITTANTHFFGKIRKIKNAKSYEIKLGKIFTL